MSGRKPLIAGNWKMHKTIKETLDLITGIKAGLQGNEAADVLVAPPFTALSAAAGAVQGSNILLAGQNLHQEPSGAYTGEVSGQMIRDTGATHVIIGHSERRQYFGETDGLVNLKTRAALAAGLIPIFCLGETLEEREAGRTFEVLARQLEGGLKEFSTAEAAKIIIAYEPVWAIGTGKTATNDQAQEVHYFLRDLLGKIFEKRLASDTRILYGGSVKPDNAADLLACPDVDGALVGGASLKADSFLGIIHFDR
ncbi:MAG: triose-phosphate isomerase [Deltaproteobacteria bacterium]|nr:triose-phosphate isomerase [Deltaproteobacteria bacterium]